MEGRPPCRPKSETDETAVRPLWLYGLSEASRALHLQHVFTPQQTALIFLELVVLVAAIWVFRHNHPASILSFVAFGVHFLVTFAA